ncbi:hypothetical protein NL676_005365 [Syzygium grande]|nr:hypothetical protein NL676_005365 [Syzygium grande]
MSLETFANRHLPAKENSQMVECQSIDYHPSLWEDYLAKYSSSPSNSMVGLKKMAMICRRNKNPEAEGRGEEDAMR